MTESISSEALEVKNLPELTNELYEEKEKSPVGDVLVDMVIKTSPDVTPDDEQVRLAFAEAFVGNKGSPNTKNLLEGSIEGTLLENPYRKMCSRLDEALKLPKEEVKVAIKEHYEPVLKQATLVSEALNNLEKQ